MLLMIVAMTNFSLLTSYSQFNPKILDRGDRQKIAQQILTTLTVYLGIRINKRLKILDVGCSSGAITNYLASYFTEVVGIDIDLAALDEARRKCLKANVRFLAMDATEMKFASRSFDILICNQVYCALVNPEVLFSEMFRVLKPGGICFFGARNKYTLWDAQYHLPLLAFFPPKLASSIVKMTGKAQRYIPTYRSYWQLQNLCRLFIIHRYTPRIISQPKTFGFQRLSVFAWLLRLVPLVLWKRLEPVLPNFIWILEKPRK